MKRRLKWGLLLGVLLLAALPFLPHRFVRDADSVAINRVVYGGYVDGEEIALTPAQTQALQDRIASAWWKSASRPTASRVIWSWGRRISCTTPPGPGSSSVSFKGSNSGGKSSQSWKNEGFRGPVGKTAPGCGPKFVQIYVTNLKHLSLQQRFPVV